MSLVAGGVGDDRVSINPAVGGDGQIGGRGVRECITPGSHISGVENEQIVNRGTCPCAAERTAGRIASVKIHLQGSRSRGASKAIGAIESGKHGIGSGRAHQKLSVGSDR